MPVPISQMATVATYVLKQKLKRVERFPMVLMLEPLYRCNLACAGCGKIQYPSRVLKSQLTVEECLAAADACPAPMVSIPGGEPLMHPEIDRLVEGLVARRKYIYLCTNAILLEEKLDLFEPSKYLSFSVHLDGLEEEHDNAVCRKGIYEKAVSAIRAARARGFRVTTNTTLFDGADPDRTAQFFDTAMDLGIEGMMVSPGYSYDKAPDQGHFLARDRTKELFRRILSRPAAKNWRFNQSPLFIEFLAGGRDYDCIPWSMPAFSVFGWQKPCYLLQEGYADTYEQLLEETQWADYGPKSGNPKCRDCMVHCGYEAAAVEDAFSSPAGLFAMARAFLFGPKIPAPQPGELAPAAAPDFSPGGAPTRGWEAESSAEALKVAFDYRGDATLTLDDGEQVEGYVADVTSGAVRLWEKGDTKPVHIPANRIARVALTGRDPVRLIAPPA
jgi:hopanoid biosynthesis associated radical SAM protein HpnH